MPKKLKNGTQKRGKQELPFILMESKPLNLAPKKFVHSITFSKMMDRAYQLAIRRNDSFSKS